MSDDDEKTYISTDGLDRLAVALKGKVEIKVGILGGGGKRKDGLTNAEVGSFHEFGTVHTPQRSFLRMPIETQLDKKLQQAGLLNRQALRQLLKGKSFYGVALRIATIAEGVVLEAFNTGGYGAWPPSNMTHKTVHQTLVETQQLRDSITSEVTEKK